MILGIPKEIKDSEYRVSVTPSGASELINEGHTLIIQSEAGKGSGFSDEDYIKKGCKIVKSIKEVYAKSEIIIKVKEPIEQEYNLIKNNQIIFTYLHLSSNKKLTKALLKSGATCISYETITSKSNNYPLLAPMSEIAGKAAVIIGAYYLGINNGGSGILVCGVSGILPGKVLIIGAGVAGKSAVKVASGLGARVVVMSPFPEELRNIELNNCFDKNVSTILLNDTNLSEQIKDADILISAVYIKGAKTPIIVKRSMIKEMKKGSVIVAVDIDQGSSIETAKVTKHNKPVYFEEGILHYCVSNIPGIFAKTSTNILTSNTLKYIKKLSNNGLKALREDKELFNGLMVYKGNIISKRVAEDLDLINFYKKF